VVKLVATGTILTTVTS